MIVPNKFYHTRAATRLRDFLAKTNGLQQIVDFGDSQVFSGATNYCCIVFWAQDKGKSLRYVRAKAGLDILEEIAIPRSDLSPEPWHFEDRNKRAIFLKMEQVGKALETLVAAFRNRRAKRG